MAGFEESDLYAAFGLDQPAAPAGGTPDPYGGRAADGSAGGKDPEPAEPGQAAQTPSAEPLAGSGEQQTAQTQEQEPSQDQGDGEAQGGAGGGVGMDCHNTSPFRGANRSPRAPFVNQSRLWPPNP